MRQFHALAEPMQVDLCPLGSRLQKYWDRRRELFSKFDDGIEVDEQGLYSIKPEAVALEIASKLSGRVVLDACCGVGGTTIALARSGKHVIAIDNNSERLRMAENNARIYGVSDKIDFRYGDAIESIHRIEFDAIYLDPAWGGPEYTKQKIFPLAGFAPNGRTLLQASLASGREIAISVPKNINLCEIASFERSFSIDVHKVNRVWLFSTIYFKSKP